MEEATAVAALAHPIIIAISVSNKMRTVKGVRNRCFAFSAGDGGSSDRTTVRLRRDCRDWRFIHSSVVKKSVAADLRNPFRVVGILETVTQGSPPASGNPGLWCV